MRPYEPHIRREPCEPMKPPVMPGRYPSKKTFPVKPLCFDGVRKCSQVDSHTGYV